MAQSSVSIPSVVRNPAKPRLGFEVSEHIDQRIASAVSRVFRCATYRSLHDDCDKSFTLCSANMMHSCILA